MVKTATRPLGPVDLWLILALFVGSLLLYGLTAAWTVTGEDAGELLAAAHGFGVPHPPGYPLWLLLAWLADHAVPLGTTAWRVSMVSGVFAAAAVALFLAVALKTLRSRIAAVGAALLFAVSLTHWRQAVIPEVYGLNTFFVTAIALLLVRLAERPSSGRLIALAAVTGLSCTNHPTAIPIAALTAVAAVLIAPELLRRVTTVTAAVVAGIAPLGLYFVLSLASASDPYVDWGNPESPGTLWEHATRAQYASAEAKQEAAGDYGDYLRRLGFVAHSMTEQFGTGWVLLLAPIGVVALGIRQTGVFLYLFGVGWLCSVGVTKYSSFSFDREHVYANQIFWIPAWAALAWMVGGGIDAVLGWLERRARGIWFAVTVLLVGVAVVHAGAKHYPLADRSQTTFIADYGAALLDVMEPGALYFPSSDHSTFALMYWQGVMDYRTDVVLADKYGYIEPGILDAHLLPKDRTLLNAIPPRAHRRVHEAALIKNWPGPVYFASRRDMSDLDGHVQEPAGPIFRIMSEEGAEAWWAGDDPPGLAIWDGLRHLLEVEDRLDFTVQMVHSELLYMRGFAQLRAGRLDDAVATWEGIEADLAPLKQMFNNVGSALAEHPRYLHALRNLALVHRAANQPGAAIRTLQAVLEHHPDERAARIELARLLEQEERVLESLAQYEHLAASDRSDPLPWREAGELLHRIGDFAKAEDAYVEALRLDPDQPEIREQLARVQQRVDLLAEGISQPQLDDHGELLQPSSQEIPQVPGPFGPSDPTEALRPFEFDALRNAPLPRVP